MSKLVIVGAGPAGLAAGNATAAMSPLVLEAGRHLTHRDQDDRVSLVQGVGGSGLYSDGKFSFWPSATGLWALDPDLVRPAYEWFAGQASAAGITVPTQPASLNAEAAHTLTEKRYPSSYATQESRENLIQRLSDPLDIRTGTTVQAIYRSGSRWLVDTSNGTHEANNIILATGRFGPLLLKQDHGASRSDLRIEVGVRIEQPSDLFFLRDHPMLDPKYIWHDNDDAIEWRTFCCCRNGLVADTKLGDYVTVSGRADGPPTGRSNVGFNIRLKDAHDIHELWPELEKSIAASAKVVRCSLEAALQRSSESVQLESMLGTRLFELLHAGLQRLIERWGRDSFREATLIAPTLEGVGSYLTHDAKLQTTERGLWVAGDAAGTFRGLTAGLVSGYIAGLSVLRKEKG